MRPFSADISYTSTLLLGINRRVDRLSVSLTFHKSYRDYPGLLGITQSQLITN